MDNRWLLAALGLLLWVVLGLWIGRYTRGTIRLLLLGLLVALLLGALPPMSRWLTTTNPAPSIPAPSVPSLSPTPTPSPNLPPVGKTGLEDLPTAIAPWVVEGLNGGAGSGASASREDPGNRRSPFGAVLGGW